MKKKILATAIALTMATTVSACSSTLSQQQTAQVVGGLLGAGLGYGLGKGHSGKNKAILGGLVLGAMAGDWIGNNMSAASQGAHTQTVAHTLEHSPIGQTNTWSNPDAYQREQGQVQVVNTYQSNGRYCREFTQTIMVGGSAQNGYGTACRQPDGQWQMVQR